MAEFVVERVGITAEELGNMQALEVIFMCLGTLIKEIEEGEEAAAKLWTPGDG